jgi:paraquat-inducible protein A
MMGYLALAGLAAWQTIQHATAATDYFDRACEKQNVGNAGVEVIGKFEAQHRLIGPLIVSFVGRNFHLPSAEQASGDLKEVPRLYQLEWQEEWLADRWSWLLLGLSLAYLVTAALAHHVERARNVLFALSGISMIFFLVGIMAPVMMISTTVHDFFGEIPILQHKVRSISSVIGELFTSGHWIFGGFITLFSIATPSVKILLTFMAPETSLPGLSLKITEFLNAIDKWSMTDVLVAAVILACFTMESGQGTLVIPCRGLFYFAGYALLSMTTTSLLTNLNSSDTAPPGDSWGQLRIPITKKLVAVAIFVSAVYALKK